MDSILSDYYSVLFTISLFDADYWFFGENAGDNFMSSISSIGDIDNDGFDDVMIGAPHHGFLLWAKDTFISTSLYGLPIPAAIDADFELIILLLAISWV